MYCGVSPKWRGFTACLPFVSLFAISSDTTAKRAIQKLQQKVIEDKMKQECVDSQLYMEETIGSN